MGMVFQAYNLFPHLSVLGNVTLALRKVHGVARARRDDRGLAMLDRVGLAAKARPGPTTSPAASSSGSRSPGRWSPTRG